MTRSFILLSALITTFTAPLAFASTFSLTCGKNAYEALEAKEPRTAEFALIVKTKGKHNPAELEYFQDDSQDQTADASLEGFELADGRYEISVHANGYRYQIDAQDCQDLDESTGTVQQQTRNRPGSYVPYNTVASAKCNCVKE